MTSKLPNTKRPRVLIVDDEPALLRLFRRTLEETGFDVVTADNGIEALAMFETGAYDVILSDLRMQEIGGLELLRGIRQHDLDVPVLLMTGGPEVATAIKAVEYGALRYMVKPFTPAELVKAVTQAVSVHEVACLKRAALHLANDDLRRFGDRAGLEATFMAALESLWMAFQPVISWSGKRVIAYEALLRTSNPVLTNPGAVLGAAERLGRLNDVGRAVRTCVARLTADAPTSDIYVNLHSQDLRDDDLFDRKAPLSLVSQRIVLEITERASLEDMGDVAERLVALRAMGYRVAIDDLGAGYAGLGSFTRIQPEIVKIDMALIRGIDTSPTKQRLVASMTDLCRDLEMAVICEGIETIGERDTVTGLGCDLLQGYLFARPAAGFPEARY